MTKISLLQAIAATLLACGLSAVPAQAESERTFVSGHGTDSGACTIALPCKTFAFALDQTIAGGEIDVLDPSGYGAVTINKAISIVNDGVGTAGILNTMSGGVGITINAGASDSVHLRGLTITGLVGTATGILFNNGGDLEIENCIVRGFVNGIYITPSESSRVSVSNTIASNNGRGIVFVPFGSAVVTGALSNVTTNNNFNGILVNGQNTTGASLSVTIVDSEASNNGFFGVRAVSASGAAATAVTLHNFVSSNNGFGLVSDNNSILRVGHSVVTGNSGGVSIGTGGMMNSYSDNEIDGNTNNNTSVLTPLAKH